MKNLIFTIFSAVILLKIISICDGLCFEDCKEELPKRINWWKSKNYGLEIPGEVKEDKELEGYDKTTQIQVDDIGRSQMMSQVDRLLRNNKSKGLPDFTIVKLDPISYEFHKKKMLITFSNVKITNLDGYAFNKEAAKFSQKGVYEKGDYEIDNETYEKIRNKKNNSEVARFLKRIEPVTGTTNKYILKRRDCKWTLDISAKFVTKQGTNFKPIIIETKFKIQPDKTIGEQTGFDENLLRARGVAIIEFHDFKFDLTFDITHIDDPLRPFLKEEIRSENLVPDFNVEYSTSAIKVKEIKLLHYDKDDDFPKIMDPEKNNVNDPLPSPKKLEEGESSEKSQSTNEEEKELIDEEKNRAVTYHFEVLKNLIQNNPDDLIRKKLCRNLLPKMAWKIMHMKTKRQLPALIYEIMAYEDDFNEKTTLPPITAKGWLFMGKDAVTAKLSNNAVKFMNFIGIKKPASSNQDTLEDLPS